MSYNNALSWVSRSYVIHQTMGFQILYVISHERRVGRQYGSRPILRTYNIRLRYGKILKADNRIIGLFAFVDISNVRVWASSSGETT